MDGATEEEEEYEEPHLPAASMDGGGTHASYDARIMRSSNCNQFIELFFFISHTVYAGCCWSAGSTTRSPSIELIKYSHSNISLGQSKAFDIVSVLFCYLPASCKRNNSSPLHSVQIMWSSIAELRHSSSFSSIHPFKRTEQKGRIRGQQL